MIAPAVQELADSLVTMLHAAKLRHDVARDSIRDTVTPILERLVPVGTVIEDHHAYALGFGRVRVALGSAHGGRRFETVSTPRLQLDRSHLSLSIFRVDAWPLNAAGKRLGAGVTLSIDLFGSKGPDDNRTDTQLLAELLARALT